MFRARHLTLNRVVALKMLLGGGFAAPHHLARFLIEGETLAGLDHPDIVTVFEVGEQDGRPFLALEYVGGGTLADRVKKAPLAPQAAARLVEMLARAAHYAHQRGGHRDLKPANVLVVDGGDGPDGVPRVKVADFGLARAAGRGDGLTETGVAAGTPGYMTPEQARGDRHIGPAADVYALGAILFDLLAGRPPFRGQTPADTIRQVLDLDPPRPSRHRPGVPRDLETIALKCLAKEPARRYPSAEALADDLRRWLTGEPIHARPVGEAERAVKWARRRPALAAALAACAVLAVCLAVITAAVVSMRRERDAVVAERDNVRAAEARR